MQRAAEILSATDHRPWSLPSRPWIMMQSWHNLLFAHWAFPADTLRPLVPEPLELDTYEGEAWVAVTPFYLRLRPRNVPVILGFPEMNCRTYVFSQGKPGILFFSLDAGSRLAVWGARNFYLLPYYYADMKIQPQGHTIGYSSDRRSGGARFRAKYRAVGPVRRAVSGSLEHWLTERYCLYAYSGKNLYRGEIHHIPWPLQDATCEIVENTVGAATNIPLAPKPRLLHFASELSVLIWPLQQVV